MKINPNEILGKPCKHMDFMGQGLDSQYESFATENDMGGVPIDDIPPKKIISTIKEQAPDIYRDCFTRIYKGVDRFSDWHTPYMYAALALLNGRLFLKRMQQYDALRNNYMFVMRWLTCGKPHYFLEKDVFEAIRDTAAPVDFDFADFKLPDAAQVFSLPLNALTFREHKIAYIGISKYEIGHHIYRFKDYIAAETNLTHDRILLVAGTSTGEWFFAPSFPWVEMNRIIAMDAEEFQTEANAALDKQRAKGEETIRIKNRDDAVFVHNMLIWSLNLMLAMEALPELIEKGKYIAKTRIKKSNVIKEIWTPNIIGRKYRVLRDPSGEHGTHASPRMHRRRGHFRKQGVGHRNNNCGDCGDLLLSHYKKQGQNADFCQIPDCGCTQYVKPKFPYSDYRVIWVQPCWVNPLVRVSGAPDKAKVG